MAIGAVGGAGAAVQLLLPVAPTAPPLRAGRADEIPLRGLRELAGASIFVLHEDEGFAALSARCPHLGCMIARRGAGFLCPCHGSEFGARGELVRGAATRGLRWLRVEVTGEGVYVDPSTEVPEGTFVNG